MQRRPQVARHHHRLGSQRSRDPSSPTESIAQEPSFSSGGKVDERNHCQTEVPIEQLDRGGEAHIAHRRPESRPAADSSRTRAARGRAPHVHAGQHAQARWMQTPRRARALGCWRRRSRSPERGFGWRSRREIQPHTARRANIGIPRRHQIGRSAESWSKAKPVAIEAILAPGGPHQCAGKDQQRLNSSAALFCIMLCLRGWYPTWLCSLFLPSPPRAQT